MELLLLAVIVLAALFAVPLIVRAIKTVTIYDYEKGLRYVDGILKGEVGPGRHRLFGNRTVINKTDMRPQPLLVSGQEVPTRDHVGVRVSLVGHYQIVDIIKAQHESPQVLYDVNTAVQLALRECVSSLTLDELLTSRGKLDKDVLQLSQKALATSGVMVKDLALRDVILPTNLKKALSGAIEAQKDAMRNLEKAKGEQAVLRSLANTARLLEGNPHILHARLIQILEQGSNTIVFGADGVKVEPKRK